jgi:hypothetical protein
MATSYDTPFIFQASAPASVLASIGTQWQFPPIFRIRTAITQELCHSTTISQLVIRQGLATTARMARNDIAATSGNLTSGRPGHNEKFHATLGRIDSILLGDDSQTL